MNNEKKLNGWPSNYFVKDKTLYTNVVSPHKDEIETKAVSALVHVGGLIRDENSENWGRVILFDDPDGYFHEVEISNQYFTHDSKSTVIAELRKAGLTIYSEKLLYEFLTSCHPKNRYLRVYQTGWADGRFVLSNCHIFGPQTDNNDKLFLSATNPESFDIRGILDDWKYHIGRYCVGNPTLIFAVSTAFAAPLLRLCNMEGGGIHLYAGSSSGKTTTLSVAASVCGGPKYLKSWRTTDNALESIARAHNDSLLILDEIGQVDSRKIGDIAYMLGNGVGKARARAKGGLQNIPDWRLLFLSCGELSFEAMVNQTKKRVYTGQQVRFLDIPVGSDGDMGLFDNIHEAESSKLFAEYLSKVSGEFYGSPLESFLENLTCKMNDVPKWFESFCAEHANEFSGDSVCGASRRILNRFLIIAFAGELASEFNITGWPKGAVLEATQKLFKRWLDAHSGGNDLQWIQLQERIRWYFETYRESRFSAEDDSVYTKHAQLSGFITCEQVETGVKMFQHNNPNTGKAESATTDIKKDEPELEIFNVFHEAFKQDIIPGFDIKWAKEQLKKHGWIVVNEHDRYMVPKRYNGEVHRVLVFDSKKIWPEKSPWPIVRKISEQKK